MILAIGDSNLYPACTESGQPIDPTNMAVVFSEQLNQPFTCWGKNGASNFWIEAHIEYFLADPNWDPDTLLFVGWTSFEREEWPWLYSNISVCGGPDFGMPEPMKAKFNQWKETLTDDYVQDCINMWHSRIHQMHLKLRERNIPHLFWTTYDNFKSIDSHKDWHGNFYMPYEQVGCMCKILESKQLTAIAGDLFHYDATAQAAWATELSNYVKEIL